MLAGLVLVAGTSWAEEDASARSISIDGQGEVSLPPDVAFVRIGVVAENESAEVAQSEVNRIVTRILDELRKAKIEQADLQTVELQIFPVYANERISSGGESPRIQGYRASNVVRVTVRDLTRVGGVIDAALGAGGNRVDGVEFSLKDDRPARREALQLAVADGRTKAAAIGEALGVKLGALRSLREAGSVPGPFPEARMMSNADSGASALPGQIRVQARVTMEYEIE